MQTLWRAYWRLSATGLGPRLAPAPPHHPQLLRERGEPVPAQQSLEAARGIKESFCYVCADPHKEAPKYAEPRSDKYWKRYQSGGASGSAAKLFDIAVGPERFLGPEAFFRPELLPGGAQRTPLPAMIDSVVQARWHGWEGRQRGVMDDALLPGAAAQPRGPSPPAVRRRAAPLTRDARFTPTLCSPAAARCSKTLGGVSSGTSRRQWRSAPRRRRPRWT